MSQDHAPVSGTCGRCGCPLGYSASVSFGDWYCCGGCSGSDRCTCGCNDEQSRDTSSDEYVPARRMFASNHPLELRTKPDFQNPRAFPFADKRRGR